MVMSVRDSSLLASAIIFAFALFLPVFVTGRLHPVSVAPRAASNSSTSAACEHLASELGENKVSTAGLLSISYHESVHHYYNHRNSQNKPTCVVTPTTSKDVAEAMKAIRAANATFAVKAGGHMTNTGWNSVNDGILIDFKNMKGKSYDADAHTATIQPGNRWGDTYPFLEDYGQTVVGGRLSDVGSGLLLGGGLSYLSAEYGLGSDNFVSLEVVLPSGELVTATRHNEYSDLFWALKGGGNQFGVVASYTLQAHPIGDFYAGDLTYGKDQMENVLKAAATFINTNTDPRAAIIVTDSVVPVLDEVIIVFCIYDGPDAGQAFDHFGAIPHLLDTRGKKTYTQVTTMNDIGSIYGSNQLYRVGSYRITEEKVKSIYDTFHQFADDYAGLYQLASFDLEPVPASLVEQSRKKGGNALDSPDGPYAWANFVLSTDPLLSESKYNKVRAAFEKMVLDTESTPGLPLFLNDGAIDFKSYGGYEKLKAIKAKYDPDNYFSTHQQGPSF